MSVKQAKDAANATMHGIRKRPAPAAAASKQGGAPAEEDDEDGQDRPRSFATAREGTDGARSARLPVKGKDGVLRAPVRALERPEAAAPRAVAAADNDDDAAGDGGEAGEEGEDDEDDQGAAVDAPWQSTGPAEKTSGAAASSAARRGACKVQLASLATEILEDPEAKVRVCAHDDNHAVSLCERAHTSGGHAP